jgi:hypothetical protein
MSPIAQDSNKGFYWLLFWFLASLLVMVPFSFLNKWPGGALMVCRHDFYLKMKMAYPASGAKFYWTELKCLQYLGMTVVNINGSNEYKMLVMNIKW